MKRILFILLCMILPLCSFAEDHDFGNPPHPSWNDPDKLYTVKVECVPFIGTASSVQQKKAGDNVYVSANPGPGVIFDGWYDTAGNLLKEGTSYSFTMPAADVLLYARFHYDPANPESPVWPLMKYTLTPKVEPLVAASTSPTKPTLYEEGSQVYVSANTNPGFIFQYWKDETGFVVSTERNFHYTMPSHDATLTAVYEYDPQRPENPGANIWQEDLGVAYVTDFQPGTLSDALNKAIGSSSNRSKVTHLIVEGEMSETDLNIFSSTFNYATIDLSATSGYSKIPASRFKDKTTLIEILLPAGINEIASRAFAGCTSLHDFTILAEEPPMLASDAFGTLDKSAFNVYVPSDKVDDYKANDSWKDFNILPEQGKMLQLDVLLPAECSDGRYKHMRLAVRDLTTNNSQYYTVTDELRYTFAKLKRNHCYRAELLTASGSILAKTDNFMLSEFGTTVVTLSDFVSKFNVSLGVKTAATAEWPEGQDVTEHATIVWTHTDGSPISVGTTVPDLDEGEVLHYSIELDREIGTQYFFPEEQDYTVVTGDNHINIVLLPIERIKALGTLYGPSMKPLDGAQVYFTQTLNGRYTVETMATTAVLAEGSDVNIETELYALPYHVRISKLGYTTKEDDIEQSWIEHTKDEFGRTYIDNYQLKRFEGASVTMSHNYSSDIFGGHESFISQPYYPETGDLTYTAYNKTSGKEVTLSVVHPVLKIADCLPGDEIDVTCHSLSGKFDDATVTIKVDEKGFANADFSIVANPTVHYRYDVSYNAKTVALLYDYATGNLVRKEKFASNDVYMEYVPTGKYYAIIMGESDYYNNVASYHEFSMLGLAIGTDYYGEAIEVEQGKVCRVKSIKVPTFDESRFFYTGENTNFVVDRPNAIVESTFKLTARVDFKEKFLGKVSDVQLVFDLPADNEFIAGSVMVGEYVSPYDLTDNRLTVNLGTNYTDAVRFCLRPIKRGNFAPTAYAVFNVDYEGTVHTVKQPIGSANFTASDITIWSEPLVSTPQLFVDGNAPAFAAVEVYDGDNFLGTAKALANGYWSLETLLHNPRNLSVHPIHAKAKTTEGKSLESEVCGVEYNTGAIQAKDVTMTFFNGLMNKTVWVQWDLEHGTTSSKNYEFANAKDFIFVANLTNNDPKAVDEVYVRVFTHTHEWVELKANYIEGMERWVANGTFTWNAMPIGVRTRVVTNLSTDVDVDAIEETPDFYAKPDDEDDDNNVYIVNTDQQCDVEYYEPNYVIDMNQYVPEEGDYYFPITTNDSDVQYEVIRKDNGTFGFVYDNNGQLVQWNIVPERDKEDYEDSQKRMAKKAKSLVGEGEAEPRPQGPNRGRIATEIVAELKHHLYVLSNRILKTDKDIQAAISALEAKIAATDDPDLLNKYGDLLTFYTEQAYQIPSAYAQLMGYGHYAIEDINNWQRYIDRLQPCDGPDDPQALSAKLRGMEYMNIYAETYISSIQAVNLASFVYDNTGFWTLDLDDYDKDYIAFAGNFNKYVVSICSELFKATKAESNNRLRKEKRDRNMFACKYATMEEVDDKWDASIPYPVVTPIIDPSGYVYEAVPSNRIEGVTATVYYKKYYTNEFGEEVFDEVLWDATEYGQRNPLLTDAEGKYSWDVPAGEWRVKYEKEGFRTAYSEWLPVPPPQLDVNVGLFQNTQPFVHNVKAYKSNGEYKGGIDLTFDKYMDPATLTSENITIVGLTGNDVDGYEETILTPEEILFTDAEADLSGKHTYARNLTFVMDDFNSYDRVKLCINKLVESYAGIHMLQDFEQSFAVTEKIREFVAESEVVIPLAETVTSLDVAALPIEATVGQHLTAAVENAEILGIAAETADYDETGHATISLQGKMLGETLLFIADPESDTKTQVLVRVVNPLYLEDVQTPTASIATGSTVYKGTILTLETKTPEAVIYYTTDGSCPCDETGDRQRYTDRGIVLSEGVTIKAIAVNVVGVESEVAEFTYAVANTSDVFGDVDDDGDLDLDDLALLESMVSCTAEETILGDVNRDGVIDILDIATLVKLLTAE